MDKNEFNCKKELYLDYLKNENKIDKLKEIEYLINKFLTNENLDLILKHHQLSQDNILIHSFNNALKKIKNIKSININVYEYPTERYFYYDEDCDEIIEFANKEDEIFITNIIKLIKKLNANKLVDEAIALYDELLNIDFEFYFFDFYNENENDYYDSDTRNFNDIEKDFSFNFETDLFNKKIFYYFLNIRKYEELIKRICKDTQFFYFNNKINADNKENTKYSEYLIEFSNYFNKNKANYKNNTTLKHIP